MNTIISPCFTVTRTGEQQTKSIRLMVSVLSSC